MYQAFNNMNPIAIFFDYYVIKKPRIMAYFNQQLLNESIKQDELEMIKILLKKIPTLNKESLETAVYYSSLETVKELFNHRDQNSTKSIYEHFLSYFGVKSNKEECDDSFLLKLSFNNNDCKVLEYLLDREIILENLLHEAVMKNQFDHTALLLKRGFNPNSLDDIGETPLHKAYTNNSGNIVKLLIEHGADMYSKDRNGYTPMYLMAEVDNVEVMKEMIDGGFDPNTKELGIISPLKIACHGDGKQACIKSISMLLKYDDIDLTCLLEANQERRISNNQRQQIFNEISKREKLINKRHMHGTSNMKIKEERTLLAAMKRNDLKTITELVENGFDVNRVMYNFFTSLPIAVFYKSTEIVEMLLKKGARINEINMLDQTPLYIASATGNLDIVKILLKHGAKTDVCLNKGSALHIAADRGHLSIVKELVNADADISLRFKGRKTALDLAIQEDRQEVVNYLKTAIEMNDDFDI